MSGGNLFPDAFRPFLCNFSFFASRRTFLIYNLETQSHYFDHKISVLEEWEEEQLFRHPWMPISCNQAGTLYFDEDLKEENWVKQTEEWQIKDSKGIRDKRGRLRIVHECFTGEKQTIRNFRTLDGNPYNTRYENVVYSPEMSKEAELNFVKFVSASVQHMVKREEWLTKRGINPVYYWSFFGLPNWLKKAYGSKIYRPAANKAEPKITKQRERNFDAPLSQKVIEMDERSRMVRQRLAGGITISSLAKELNMSRLQIRNARDRILPEDI